MLSLNFLTLHTSGDVFIIGSQKVKAEHRHPTKLLQPLPIPEWKWEVVTMDFITGLPRTSKQHDSIMVVVDKLTKSAHFIPLKTTHRATYVANIFLK
jgi:hypothetical protein